MIKKFVYGILGPSAREKELEKQVNVLSQALEDRDRQIKYLNGRPSYEAVATWTVHEILDKLANDARQEVLGRFRKMFTDRVFRVIEQALDTLPDRDGQRLVMGAAIQLEDQVAHLRFEMPKQGAVVRLAM